MTWLEFLFSFKIILLCMCDCFACTCVHPPLEWLGAMGGCAEEGTDRVTDAGKPLSECWELSLGPLGQWLMLLTTETCPAFLFSFLPFLFISFYCRFICLFFETKFTNVALVVLELILQPKMAFSLQKCTCLGLPSAYSTRPG